HRAVMHDHPNLMEWQVYACGAPIMVESAQHDFVVKCGLPDDAWTGRTGLVHHAVMHDHPDLMNHQVYACGAPIMVESAHKDFVMKCGLPDDEFYADSFTSEADKHGA
ncbi:MAG TPA: hypothetical protein VFA35_04980, partial [Burkholderiaceae bacterium]|nr:hypothetical protein [Burkholderiaceae bacterium]